MRVYSEQFVAHELSHTSVFSLKVSFTKGFHSGFLAQRSIVRSRHYLF